MRTMASTLTLQLFRNKKPAVSISLDLENDDTRGVRIPNCPQPSYETQTEKKKIMLFYHEHY